MCSNPCRHYRQDDSDPIKKRFHDYLEAQRIARGISNSAPHLRHLVAMSLQLADQAETIITLNRKLNSLPGAPAHG